MKALTTEEHNLAIQNAPALGGLTWKYGKKFIFADIIDIEYSFPETNEYFVRIRALYQRPLVRVKNNLIYFLTERASNGELDWPEFETRGIKCEINIL